MYVLHLARYVVSCGYRLAMEISWKMNHRKSCSIVWHSENICLSRPCLSVWLYPYWLALHILISLPILIGSTHTYLLIAKSNRQSSERTKDQRYGVIQKNAQKQQIAYVSSLHVGSESMLILSFVVQGGVDPLPPPTKVTIATGNVKLESEAWSKILTTAGILFCLNQFCFSRIFKWPSFFFFVFSTVNCKWFFIKILLMTGFELRTYGPTESKLLPIVFLFSWRLSFRENTWTQILSISSSKFEDDDDGGN